MSATEHTALNVAHVTHYIAAGPEDGPLVIFCHGWPELAISWRHQLPCLGALGFRAVAPDMRGYGRSTVHDRHEDYEIERIVGDMLDLLDHLGREHAIWVGHDWGAPVVWSLAAHHPERCQGVAALCVPYLPATGEQRQALIDRDIYPEKEFPHGQWEYQTFYVEDFTKAIAPFDADPEKAIKALFRKGDPSGSGKPAVTAYTRQQGGWFGGAPVPPDVPLDTDVISDTDLAAYTAALTRNGFFGPGSWYMNHPANGEYAARAPNGGVLEMPVLFLLAQYDFICECIDSRLAEPMRAHCRSLTEVNVPSGHWMAQERPRQVNAALVNWIATELPDCWPRAQSG